MSTSDSTHPATSSAMGTWQQWQAKFHQSSNSGVSLLDDNTVSPTTQRHMQLTKSSSLAPFFPFWDGKQREDDMTNVDISSDFPLVPLRRDHSSGGGAFI